jgi:hypothetical protein
MTAVTVLALTDSVLMLNVYDARTHPSIAVLVLSIAVAALVSVGATFGGTLVSEYGSNVETAGDSPACIGPETDVMPGDRGDRSAEPIPGGGR